MKFGFKVAPKIRRDLLRHYSRAHLILVSLSLTASYFVSDVLSNEALEVRKCRAGISENATVRQIALRLLLQLTVPYAHGRGCNAGGDCGRIGVCGLRERVVPI